MPLYELFCLTRPGLPRKELVKIIMKACNPIVASKGVITDIKSFGEQQLAYKVKIPGDKFDHVRLYHPSIPPYQLHTHFFLTLPHAFISPDPPPPSPSPQAAVWQCTFASNPTTLSEIDQQLRVDERIVRWLFFRRQLHPSTLLPNSYAIAQQARHLLNQPPPPPQ